MLKQLTHYGEQANSHDITKAIAVIAMVIDHIGWITQQEWMRVIGRLAAPLFFFLIGYSKMYQARTNLLVYGLLLTVFHCVFLHPSLYINILLNIIFIRVALLFLSPIKLDRQILLALFIACNVGNFFGYKYIEYGMLGLQIALLGLFIREQRPYAVLWGITTLANYAFVQAVWFHMIRGPYFIALLVISGLLLAWFVNYSSRIWLLPQWLRWPTLFLSRYSLPIYFFHYTSIIVIYILWHNGVF